jgi:hypothetical protein
MRVGTSHESESADAARKAVEEALAGDSAALVIVFVSPIYDMQEVATAANAAARGAPLVGCSTSGEIGGGVAGSGRIVAIALGGEGFTARTSCGFISDGAEASGASAAQGLIGLESPHKVLILLAEGLAGHHSEMVRGAYGIAGAGVKLVGGCAGDDLAMTGTWQIHGGEVYRGAVVGVALGSDGPFGVGVCHGWVRSGDPMVVTESDGQRILRIDDQPALDRYLTQAGIPESEWADDSAWPDLMLRTPLALPRPSGDDVRAVLSADPTDRSLACGDVPFGALVSMMSGDADSVISGTEQACSAAIAGLGGVPPIGVVAFDCAGRRAILGEDGLVGEMAGIAEQVGDVPVGGFYTYGEFARSAGSRGVHSATLVMLALG